MSVSGVMYRELALSRPETSHLCVVILQSTRFFEQHDGRCSEYLLTVYVWPMRIVKG